MSLRDGESIYSEDREIFYKGVKVGTIRKNNGDSATQIAKILGNCGFNLKEIAEYNRFAKELAEIANEVLD